MIDAHNKDAAKHGYTLGMNHFGDMTREEVVEFNGYIMRPMTNDTSKMFVSDPNFVPDDTVDWREKGAVTVVKNQGQCGSCWSFSATGSLEGQHFLKDGGELVSLSEQNLMDCSTAEGNNGCKGGLMVRAFEYVIRNGGIDTEASYPYQAHNEICRYEASNRGATCQNYERIPEDSTSGLMEACSTIGPISVAMDASLQTFHFYKQGVYSDYKCSSTKLDHGVLVVGYGNTEGEDYFLVKNSWGANWGMDGYFMISRSRNMCGIATQASYPIV